MHVLAPSKSYDGHLETGSGSSKCEANHICGGSNVNISETQPELNKVFNSLCKKKYLN